MTDTKNTLSTPPGTPGLGRQFLRFTSTDTAGLIGHYMVLIIMVEWLTVHAVAASFAGFIAGTFINYTLHHHLTFASGQGHRETTARFVVIAFAGLCLNTLIMLAGHGCLAMHYLISQAIATVFVLFWNFIANRWWIAR